MKNIKAKGKTLPILYVADDLAFKIVETDASNIGWESILKQKNGDIEQIVQFASGDWNPAEQNYSTIEKEVKAAWNCIRKFEVYLINKLFLLRTDASALQKVLTKDIRKAGEAKFARWQEIFANFDFQVEYIKGAENSLPDFFSREYIEPRDHVMMIVTKWDQNQKQEVLRTILEDQDWEEYKRNWKPTWKLRNKKVLDANLQPHTNIQHLVLERKIYPKRSKWIHDMIYEKAQRDAYIAEVALQQNIHDIVGIWYNGGASTGIYEKYFCIYRTRNLTWTGSKHWPTHPAALWPKGDPKIIFPGTVYDFAGYKKLCWDFFNVDDKVETHYTKLKFSATGTFQRNNQWNGSKTGDVTMV